MTLAPERPSTEAPAPPRPEPSLGLRLAMVGGLLLTALLACIAGYGAVVLVVATLVLVVVAHELGHFATAKWCGMKATEFFVGFGPRIFSFRRGETEYGLKALLFGGYVRIVGFTSLEQVATEDEPRSYMNQSFWKRVVVSSAGSAVHLLLAILMGIAIFWSIGEPKITGTTVAQLSVWSQPTPAQRAGLEVGDLITAVNGTPFTADGQLEQVTRFHVGDPVTLQVERDGVRRGVVVTPVDARTVTAPGSQQSIAEVDGLTAATGYGLIGVETVDQTSYVKLSPLGVVRASFDQVGAVATQEFSGIARFFTPSGVSHIAANDLHPSQSTSGTGAQYRPTSVLGFGQVLTDATHSGWQNYLYILVVLNVGFGIVNMLPMIPLDGGHVAIAIYERLRTRRGQPHYRADITKLLPVVYVFVAFLGFLVLSALYLDAIHPIANPFGH